MQPARPNITSRSRRRGVTLLEMLVTVALLLLMMVVIVTIFQYAAGSITNSRALTLIEQDLRRLDATIRQDLSGVTCSTNPPNNPLDNAGYLEVAENALSDAQDEDSDDTLRFTAKAPDGRPFTGRIWVPKSVSPLDTGYAGAKAVTFEPTPVTSQFAEIIYFQRGDKLYRRVRLILPKQVLNVGNQPSDPLDPNLSTIPGWNTRPGPGRFGFATNLFEPPTLFKPIPMPSIATVNGSGIPFVSWQGLNDISAQPSPFGSPTYAPIPNTLGDLTDRDKRFASLRFANDFRNNTTGVLIPDGLPDDLNGDGVYDYNPTLYPNSKYATDPYGFPILNDTFSPDGSGFYPNGTGALTNFPNGGRNQTQEVMGFPWVYPNAFSKGIQGPVGLLHTLDPSGNSFNHSPLSSGDSLLIPNVGSNGGQTWWGFPTWRETMAPTWLDPIKRINDPATAPFFNIGDPVVTGLGETPYFQTLGLSPTANVPLPPQPGPFTDGIPAFGQLDPFDLTSAPVFEDDLIAVNVKSFNIKVFDPNPRYFNTTANQVVAMLPGYYDLGYVSGINPATGAFDPTYASGANQAFTVTSTPPWMLDTMGHEGRMPPLTADNRVDAQYPTYDFVTAGSPPTITTVAAYLGDSSPTVRRMRRTWDSWSTTYTNAPATPLSPTTPYPFCGPQGGFIVGDSSIPPLIARGRAIVPSYPAPYPVPLRGIEIQIRLTDPEGRHVKSITIHQDFSDKL
jgi:type II secretory pathway pseudopilin PulG